jgi:exodeoxyribonuclease VII small subunit
LVLLLFIQPLPFSAYSVSLWLFFWAMSKKPSPADAPTLASELARLEEIVRKLEAEDADLDQSLALFEEGVKRLRGARDRLAEAELKVQAVLEQADGTLRTTDLDV